MSNRQANVRGSSHESRALNASAGDTVTRAFCLALPGADDASGWIPFLPAPDSAGRITGVDGRTWQVKDLSALAKAVRRKLPIDINHSTELAAKNGGESPAVGWLQPDQFEVRTDGSLWWKPELNERGLNAIKNREYGYVSPTFDFDRAGVIRRLVSLALVNAPNLPELALNRQQTPEETSMTLAQLLALLGLPENATLETATNAINKLKSDLQTAINARETPSLERFVPRADYDLMVGRATNAETQLATVNTAAFTTKVDGEINAAIAAGKITPATKDFYRATCLRGQADLEAFQKFIASAPVIAPDQVQRGSNSHANQGGALDADGLTEHQRAICKNLNIAPKDYVEQLKRNV